jgi:class 3 adenylate cyclase
MSSSTDTQLLLHPVVHWPRAMTRGLRYLVRVDLRLAEPAEQWPQEQEEFAFTCMLDGANDFSVTVVHDASIVVHRFGGSYGPAEFVVTPRSKTGSQSLWLTILTARGIIFCTIELPVEIRSVTDESGPETTDLTSVATIPALAGQTLSVRIIPTGKGHDQYYLGMWIIHEDNTFQLILFEEEPLSLDRVQEEFTAHFGLVVEAMRNDRLWIEFFLPTSLLDLPVDQWALSEAAPTLSAGFDYPVVVRVLDRPSEWELGGRRRWRPDAPSSQAVGWLSADASAAIPTLRASDDYMCAVFQRGLELPETVLAADLPVAVWCRDHRRSGEFYELMSTELAGRSVKELPGIVWRLRQEAVRSGRPAEHIGSQLVLLWDDPDRHPPTTPTSGQLAEDEQLDSLLDISMPGAGDDDIRSAQTAVHRTILVADIVGFSRADRNQIDQVEMRDGLYRAVELAFRNSRIPWDECYREDRGDGLLILAPATVPKKSFVDPLPQELARVLSEYNSVHAEHGRIQLRMALHAGEVVFDAHGVTGSMINHVFRLLDASSLKSALADSPGAVLALIASAWFFEEVIRHYPSAEPSQYRSVEVSVKETQTSAWIKVLDPG